MTTASRALPAQAATHSAITRGHRNLLLAAAIVTTLLVALGGIVCATESAAGCPDWPGCFGRIIPPANVNAIIEYTHRLVAALTTPLVVAAAYVSWRRARSVRWVTRPLLVAILFILAVVVFGAFAVLTGLPRLVAALDLGSALTALGLVVTAATVAAVRHAADQGAQAGTLRSNRAGKKAAARAAAIPPAVGDRLDAGSTRARLSLAAVAGLFAVYVGGILVAGPGSLTRCLGWPVWRLIPTDTAGWPQVVRMALAIGTAVLMGVVVVMSLRQARAGRALARLAVGIAAAFVVEIAFGLVLLGGTATMFVLIVYVAAAAALWSLLVAHTVMTALPTLHPA